MSEFEIDIAADTSKDAFQFVQALAAELSLGAVDIPGFPAIVQKIREVLADETSSAEKVARVVGADPVLAARLLNLANSVAILGTARPATDLRTAVSRVGLNAVRSTTYAHAVRILSHSEALRGLEKPLEVLHKQTAQVASLSHVIAGKYTKVQPDVAMLAGLLHSSGRLYLLARAGKHRGLFADANAFRNVERDWHLSVAVALLENWSVPDEIVHAIAESEDLTREPRGSPALTDVVMLAVAIGRNASQPAVLEATLRDVKCLARFGLNSKAVAEMLEASKLELAQLEAALS
ncbi:MAG TPA: HDOD domain-containing protein [Steroidobacteraceae bacterium]|jgi:HD-like signal output (HDOD) protein|nr:HDOD domain-containing protein [Steroidobacteraceae bacterium]